MGCRGSCVSLRGHASARKRGRGRGRCRGRAADSIPVQGEVILGGSESSEKDSELEADSDPEK
jgi:hypothetical protein